MGRSRSLLTILGAALVLAVASAAPAGAQIPFVPCPKGNDFACAHLSVPLDPSGAQPGTLSLAIRRHRAAVGEARTAIVALAGGPGQPAIPFAEQFAELLGPIAATRDLIVFDQRGIGESHPLSCHALEHHQGLTFAAGRVAACAAQLGPSRSLYTTADDVADIEAIRRAGGYEKLVLYGTSYGTKLAELYAEAHPDRVEALVLDSVVPPDGPEPLNVPTFKAIPRVLGEVCAQHACRGVTSHPFADLRRLLASMHDRRLRIRAIGLDGRTRKLTATPQELLGILLLGDFSGPVRAELVSATRSAVLGDYAPLGRLLETVPSEESGGEGFDLPLYYATSCEEEAFPWSRSARPAARLAEAGAAARALGPGAFTPFSAHDAIELSDIPQCAAWPFTSPFPAPAPARLPAVPTLILSGAEDLRTPTSNAREVAAIIPGSHLLVVPDVGHSVLGSDPTSCAERGLQALFRAQRIAACRPATIPLRMRPEPLPPRALAGISPARGYPGVTGRTVQGLRLTIEDLARQLALMLETSLVAEELFSLPALRTGGLRSGWAQLNSTGGLVFHDYSFVPGMTISGALRTETADLRIGGAAAAHGTLHLGTHHMLVGSLGGRSVHVSASLARSAAIVAGDDAPSSAQGGGGPRGGALLGMLARRLERLLGP
ncbi:MAG TPA: alpha/beta fold hydrolase [Solirubrobacteraceae bacterium]|jgi:pimeloyl-ACP methyl ester carboxylesterase|nr:alpha/beta fold hydrolase [Solirubrobacteraceae bacterium]